MKEITFITTTAACDDTFDKITHLNNGFKADHFKKDIIVLRGNFNPDVFEWVSGEKGFGPEGSWWRYFLQQKHTEIKEERFDDMLEILPPIYISHIDGNKVKFGFCVSEPYTHLNNGAVVLTTCYKLHGKYYTCLSVVLKNNDKYIKDTYADEYTRDNYAVTYIK